MYFCIRARMLRIRTVVARIDDPAQKLFLHLRFDEKT